jgi:hypothetical protein
MSTVIKLLSLKETIALQVFTARLSTPDSNKDPNVAADIAFQYAEAFLKVRNLYRRSEKQ